MHGPYTSVPSTEPRPSGYLTASFQPPHYGGASTFMYGAFAAFQRAGLDVQHLVVARAQDVPWYRSTFGERWWNPEDLPDVHVRVRRSYTPGDRDLIELVSAMAPRAIVTKQYPIFALLQGLDAGVLRWWLPSSCQALRAAWSDRAIDTLSDGLRRLDDLFPAGATSSITPTRDPGARRGEEDISELLDGVRAADRITCNSEATARAFRACYPGFASRVESVPGWFPAVIADGLRTRGPEPRPFAERSIDILFVASRWNRGEKNPELARALIEAYAGDHEVHVVGRTHGHIGFAVLHDLVPRPRALRLMADARVLVVPSRLDSAPSVVYEGALLGCNVVASRNCGNWRACVPELLVEDYGLDGFRKTIDRALRRPMGSRMDEILSAWPPSRIPEPLLALGAPARAAR